MKIIEPEPFIPNYKQSLYLNWCTNWNVDAIAYGGGAGAGKTRAVVELMILLCTSLPGNQIGVCRKIKKDLKKTIKKDFFEALRPELLISDHDDDGITKIRTEDPEHPSIIYWLGLDDISRWGGLHFTVIFMEEASECTVQDFNYLKTRLRHKLHKDVTIKNGNYFVTEDITEPEGYSLRRFISLTFNPPKEVDHWLYTLIYEKQVLGKEQAIAHVHTTTLDNEENLPKSYIKTLQSLPRHEYNRMFLGQRASGADGTSVCYEFKRETCLFSGSLKDVSEVPTGTDFGWKHPVMIHGAYEDGNVYIYMCTIRSRMDLRQFLKEEVNPQEKKFCNKKATFIDYCDHQHARQHSDKSRQTSEQIMRECGRNPRHSYSRPDWRGELINELIRQGRFFVEENCIQVIDCLDYGWQKDEDGEIVKDGYWEHIADAVGYLVWGVCKGRILRKSERLKQKEQLFVPKYAGRQR